MWSELLDLLLGLQTYLLSVDVPVVVLCGCTVIHIVELAPYLDITKTSNLPVEREKQCGIR